MIRVSSFLIGALFGTGLILSGMTNPAKVVNFLDILGTWDPSLGFVMGGALLVTAIGFRLVQRTREAPVFAGSFSLPTAHAIDRPLMIGALLFGAGWGLAGLCPGPAIAILPMAPVNGTIFAVAMIAGMLLHRTVPAFLSGAASST